MPLKLVPPRAGKTPFWSIRGTYLGCYIDRSTGSREKTFAAKLLQKLKRDIESGVLSGKKAIGFAKAAAAYMKAGGDSKYLAPLIKHFLHTPIEDIDQVMIDNVAVEIYPNATAATRNRQVYTPISAMLKRAGIERQIKRPKGWRGRKLTHWLTPEQARRVFKATARIEAPEKTKIKFRIYLRMLCYTGMRMNEPLQKLAKPDVNLKTATAILRDMKNGRSRLVHLPPIVVQDLRQLPGGLKGTGRLFSFHAGGRLRDLLKMTLVEAGVVLPRRVAFHVFCHTWATWMRQHGGLDTYDLVRTDRWADPESADRYAHVVVSEQARRADLLPGAKRKAG
jgi:integrase